MNDDKTDASFWLRGVAEIIAGLAQEPNPGVDIRRIEEVLHVQLGTDPASPAQRTTEVTMADGAVLYIAYRLPPSAIVYLEFWKDGAPTSPLSPLTAQEFCSLLERQNFSCEPWYGEHGRSMGFIVERGPILGRLPTSRISGLDYITGIRVKWLPL